MKRKAERTKSLNCGNGGIRDSGQNKRASVSEHEGPPSCVWLALPASFAGGPYDGSGVSLSATPSTAKKLKKKKQCNNKTPFNNKKQHKAWKGGLPTDACSSPHSAPNRTRSHGEYRTVCFHYHFESPSFGS